jgi:hypothetical protein
MRTLRQRLADEAAAKAKLVAENKQLRKTNEVLAGEVYYCRQHHTTNASMVSDFSMSCTTRHPLSRAESRKLLAIDDASRHYAALAIGRHANYGRDGAARGTSGPPKGIFPPSHVGQHWERVH